MAKKKTKKQKINYIFLIISLLIILTIYLINRLIFIRPIMWFISVILLAIFFNQFFKLSKKGVITLTVLFFFISIVLDGVIVTIFKRIPAYTYNVISSDKVNIYYSPGLRIWQCDKSSYKNLVVDQFYNKGYMCDANDIVTIDANSFLNSVIENYDDYGNKYVKINGKISKKNSQISIEMRPYIESEIKVNGYVEFSDSIVLKVFLEKADPELDNYDVYDDITIIGLVKNLEGTTGNYVIYMDNARILSTTNLTSFQISVTPESKCGNKTLLASNDTNNLYSYCLSEIFVSYEDTTSELVDTISSNKLDIKDIYSVYNKVETDSNNNKMYRTGTYSVLVCNPSNSKEVIIGKKDMKFTDVDCE